MLPNYLKPIIDVKKKEIERLYAMGIPPFPSCPRIGFEKALKKPGLSLIAEVKKASPSKGRIRTEFNPIQIASHFMAQGASALSVLTESSAFLGELRYISDIKQAGITLPILRKDFIIDPIQIDESIAAQADAILLIVAILTPDQLHLLHAKAVEKGLDVLVEVHTQDELQQALELKDLALLGINNRNLTTFEIDIQTALTLKPSREGLTVVAESGYHTQSALGDLHHAKFDAVLIGEGLATHPELITTFKEFQ